MAVDKLVVEAVAAHPFFSDMPLSEQQAIADCASEKRFDDGAVLMRQGEQADRFYLIQHGVVALELHVPGREPLVVETLGKDEVVGWSWLIPPYEVQFDARAVGVVRVLSIDTPCLREKMERDHTLGYAFYRRFLPIIADRLHAARVQLMDVYGHPADYVGAQPPQREAKGRKKDKR